jgi:hypothetical protein
MAFIGLLSRPGARLRAFADTGFDAIDPTKRAEIILNNIFSDPNKYLELSRRYDRDLMNPSLKENHSHGAPTNFLKRYYANEIFLVDYENADQKMMGLSPENQ